MNNDLIRMLSDQAREHADTYDDIGTPIWLFQYNKFFAELIVRECLEQVRDEVQYEYDWKLADAVIKRVLDHFGVE